MTLPRVDPDDLEDLARRDPLAYGILHINLLQGREWEVDTRLWLPEIYSVVNPRDIEVAPQGLARQLSIQKSTQCGMSTMGMVRMFHFADFWPVRAMYMLPRQQDYIDFVTTRVDPTIKASERLEDMLGDPDSTRAKQLGNSYLFFMESTVEPRMMPADVIFVDEIDLSNLTHVATMENRLDASNWKLKFFFSTPTVPNYGINGLYELSDQRRWYVKCDKCGTWQVMDWDQHLKVVGPRNDPKKVYFGCIKCDHPLTLDVIQQGQWVAEHPQRSIHHVGFHISQMMTHTPWELYQHFIDPKNSIREFYRKRLGKPYELGFGSLEREDVLASCFEELFDFESEPDGFSSYYLGADQGNELQILVGKVDHKTKIRKIVHMELVPYDDGGFSRIGQLMRLFRVRKAVLDADPNRHSARSLQQEFPGKLLIADYSEGRQAWTTKKDKNGVRANVIIGRSEGFDRLVESIGEEREWGLPGYMPNLSPDTELIIDHITALRRDIQTRKTSAGEKEAVVWVELRPAHLAHAWLYLKTAMEIDEGKSFRMRKIGEGGDRAGSKTREELEAESDVRKAMGFLFEVPIEQLQGFIEDKDESPFPLSYKLERVRGEGIDDLTILEAAHKVWSDKKLALDIY